MPSSVTLKQLLETGVHFGHRTQKWNPKMAPFIFTQRNGIHIIDLQQTIVNLHQYYDMVRDLVAGGGQVLFVGTKRQAQEIVAQEAGRCGMSYVNERWLGGTLTNWKTIRDRINTLSRLEEDRDAGRFDALTKRERVVMARKIEKLQLRLGGIRKMKRVPDMLIVVDTEREFTAVREANILNIPVLALVDTNANPDEIDYLIPGNDDAMRSIKIIIHALADAVIEGQNIRKSGGSAEDDEDITTMEEALRYDRYDDDDEEDDEAYLGASTLAKLRDNKLFEDGDDTDE